MNNKEYTIKEVAEILDVSSSTIRRRIKEGKIKANKKKTRYGQTYFIPASEIDKAVMEEDVLEFKKPVSVDKQEVINELIQAVNSQNKALINETMSNISQKIESQEQAIKELTEEVRQLKKQQNKSLLDRIKGLFMSNKNNLKED